MVWSYHFVFQSSGKKHLNSVLFSDYLASLSDRRKCWRMFSTRGPFSSSTTLKTRLKLSNWNNTEELPHYNNMTCLKLVQTFAEIAPPTKLTEEQKCNELLLKAEYCTTVMKLIERPTSHWKLIYCHNKSCTLTCRLQLFSVTPVLALISSRSFFVPLESFFPKTSRTNASSKA